jgi:glyoxylase-like metal-dependent hydrolase (beta-lactamase superfamily II)
MLEWTIGDIRITRIPELELVAPPDAHGPFIREAAPEAVKAIDWLFPHWSTKDGQLKTSIHALLVQAPSLTMVVDTCVGNDRPRRLLGGMALQSGFLQQFESTGIRREDVDLVLCTHLHVDHVGWNTMLVDGQWVPTFPNARYLIGEAEYTHWQGETDDAETQTILGDSVQPIFDAGLVDLVAMDHIVSPEIRLMPTPGHTPGHVSVLIESKGERAIITGDIMHHPCQIARPLWAPDFDSDKETARAMRGRFLADVADTPTLVIGTHFAAPTAGKIVRDGSAVGEYRLIHD